MIIRPELIILKLKKLKMQAVKEKPEVSNFNCEILEEDRRIDAIAIKRKQSLVTCTRLEENSPSKEEL